MLKEMQNDPKEIKMEPYDDDLSKFEADGAAPLPVTNDQSHDLAQISVPALAS
jgi:hypothetical protein